MDNGRSLTTISGDFNIEYTASLTPINFSNLSLVNGDFKRVHNQKPAQCYLEALRDQIVAIGSIGGPIEITNNRTDCICTISEKNPIAACS